MYFKISDIVIIKGDKNKELWEITATSNEIIHLKGKTKRSLMIVKENEIEKADKATIELKLKEKLEYVNYLCNNVNHWGRKNMNRKNKNKSNNIFELAGSILHLDTDIDYMEQCLKLYTKLNIPAVGFAMSPKEMPIKVNRLLKIYKPNILVITGHDLYEENKDKYNINSYVNSKFYAQTVMKAREYESDLDKLMIFSGACSSFFEVMILSGANFASSPSRVEIEALDPAIVASHIALTPILIPVDMSTCIEDTISRYDGIGGVQCSGTLKNATFKNIRGIEKYKDLYDSYKHCIKTLEEYGENNKQYSKDLCKATLSIESDNFECKNDFILNNILTNKKCELHSYRNDSSKISEQTKIKILIDPGHTSLSNQRRISNIGDKEKDIEYKINFSIYKKLEEILNKEGFEVIGTINNPYQKLTTENKAEIVKKSHADLIIKLHCNRDNDEDTNGAMVLFESSNSKHEDIYSNIIINEYCESLGISCKGINKKDNLKSIYLTTTPVILIGMGYLSNEQDRRILIDENTHTSIAQAIARGIWRCFY